MTQMRCPYFLPVPEALRKYLLVHQLFRLLNTHLPLHKASSLRTLKIPRQTAISVVTVAVTLRQNNRMIEESTRPYISVYTDEINTGNPLFYLIIKNFGKSPAYITKFESDFDFRGCYKIPTDKDYLGNLKNAVFAPGQSRICMLDYAKIGKEITFTLEYHSGAKKKYSEKFTIDLKAGVSMPYGKAATEGKELRTISYTLQEMLQKNL